jgi:hypothetical protein
MNMAVLLKSVMVVLLVVEFAAAPLAATRCLGREPGSAVAVGSDVVRSDDDDAEGVTFDTLLPAASYTVYIEARNIGTLLRSAEFREIFEPISPMLEHLNSAAEFQLVRMVADNAERLQRSRVMMVFSPTDAALPGQLLAFELESEDAAQEFEAKIQERMAALAGLARKAAGQSGNVDIPDHTSSPAIVTHRAGRLIVLSPTPFTFKQVRGTSDKLMSDDINFRVARERFYAEPLFIYYDSGLSERRRKAREDQLRKSNEDSFNVEEGSTDAEGSHGRQRSARGAGSTSSTVTLPVANVDEQRSETPSTNVTKPTNTRPPAAPASRRPRSGATINAAPPAPTRAPAAQRAGKSGPSTVPSIKPQVMQATESPTARREADPLDGLFNLLLSGEGQTPAPEAVAIALAVESDALAVRALLIGGPGAALGPVPFLSLPVSGPPLSSEAAGYLPADTGIFVAASLDWPRLCDLAARRLRRLRGMPDGGTAPAQATEFDARRAAFEKAGGARFADVLAATLGNEIALSVPVSYLSGTPLGRVRLSAQAAFIEPLVVFAVRDREALAPKLPALLAVVGVKLASPKATMEKIGEVEITSYGNLAYAFVNDYMIMAASVASIRRAIAARASGTTLAASHDFQSYTQWQPRATIAQVYVSAAVLKGVFAGMPQPSEAQDEVVKEFLTRYHFDPEPVTYAASAEGIGGQYELRLPKRLLMRVFSEIAAGEIAARIPRNEYMARSFLQTLHNQERAYQQQHGRYAALDEMQEAPAITTLFERCGYKFELSAADGGYEATATPAEYGKTGKLSFYTDQSGVVREGDHNGKPASSSDKPADAKREY